jgi:hypothetical protein
MEEGGILELNKLVLLTSSRSFPNQIYHEYLDAAGEDGESQSYGLRIEHVDGDRMAISVERPDGYVDWSAIFRWRENRLSVVYDHPEAIPEKIKDRVRVLYEFFSDGSIVLNLLKELKDKYVLVAENGSPTTVAKTPFNVLKYGIMEGKPIHARSSDGYSVDESCSTDEAENDESLIVTSPDGIGVPLLVGKYELALNLVNGKSIAEVWKRNHELLLKRFASTKEEKVT